MRRTIPNGSSLCDTKGKLRIVRAYISSTEMRHPARNLLKGERLGNVLCSI